ncbi:MAG TPA: FlgD immunoglobulin-like domain containing protein, partial [Treponemataceae bacterium]|nr:FlgD immunoglobulin-like domain containing protein [Treponemataceae bacterium]
AEPGASHGESYAWYWPGFISSATSPTGLVAASASGAITITDLAATPNSLEAIGASAYDRTPVTVSNAKSGLYSEWDVTGPAPAALRTSTDNWGDAIVAYEAVPDASGGVIDRIEMHFFDNAVNYNLATDTWAWTSRKGWYLSADSTKTQLTQSSALAPESFGGARPAVPPASEWVPTLGGIRECSLNKAIGAFSVFYNDALMQSPRPDTFSTNVSTKLLAPGSNQNVAGDPYFRLYWSGASGSGLQIAGSVLKVSYNEDSPLTTGYITDLAGNLMKSFSKITCVDRTPPRITFSLTGANRSDLYVLFSKTIDITNASEIAAGLKVNLNGTTVALTGTPEIKTANKRAFLYHLGTKVRAADLVSATSSIAIAGTGNLFQDPDTHEWVETSYFVDQVGNYAVVGDTHRLTDIGIGLAEILYGSDGVNEPGLLGGQAGALRSEAFDGTGRLLDKDITIATWINLQTAPGSLALYYDVNPGEELMPKTFNDATGSSLKLWLPSVLPGFNLTGDQDARNLSPTVITDEARLFRNFLIPESDSEIVPGAKVQLIMQYEGLFCARLTDENDVTSLAPWSFVIAETRKQRGGVTILNNVIDSNKHEKTIVQVEVPKAGNVVIQVFTLDGNIVKVLERGRKGGGTYSYYWDGSNGAGNPVARGIYFIRVVGPDMDEIRKVLVVRN